jgi:hypothetical protein
VPFGGKLVVKLNWTSEPADAVPPGVPMLTEVEELLLVLLVLLVLGEALPPPPPPPPLEQAAKARRQAEALRRKALREVSIINPFAFRIMETPQPIPLEEGKLSGRRTKASLDYASTKLTICQFAAALIAMPKMCSQAIG